MPTRRTLTLLAAVLTCSGVAACSDDSSEGAADTGEVPAGEVAGEADPAVAEAAGSFELSTTDGTVGIAGSVIDCELSGDQSAAIRFSGSVVDVVVDAEGGGGTLSVGDTFVGEIDTVDVDPTSGAVALEGEGSPPSDAQARTRFRVEGTCET